jgi:hypothetical protein
MATIPKTELATSDPLDLCKGFAIFPQIGAVRAGVSSGNKTGSVFSKSAKIVAWRGSFSLGYRALVGVCGPSFALKFALEGRAQERELDVRVTDDAMQAGFFAGLTFELPIRASLQEWKPDHWYTPWKGHWHNIGSASVTPRVDVLGALIFVLMKVIDSAVLQAVNNLVPGLIGSWGFIGSAPGGFAAGGGSLTARPTLNVPVNILPYLPDVGEVDQALSEVGIKLATGPNFGLQVPVVARIDSVDLDGVAFGSPQWNSRGFTARGDADAPDDPRNLKVKVAHTPHLTFLVGWFGSVSLVKLFRLSATINLDLLSLLGIDIKLGTYHNDLENQVGRDFAASCAECGAGAPQVEVVFQAPGEGA